MQISILYIILIIINKANLDVNYFHFDIKGLSLLISVKKDTLTQSCQTVKHEHFQEG